MSAYTVIPLYEQELTEEAKAGLVLVIAHWERLVLCASLAAILREGIGSSQCALCVTYRYPQVGCSCAKCPVQIATGAGECRHTPHRAVVAAVEATPFDLETFRGAASAMLALLKRVAKQ